MTDARIIATASCYDGLIEGLRTRKAELQLTDAALEALSGLAAGHVGKLLGDLRSKTLGPISLPLMLQGLAVKIAIVEDVEMANKMSGRWEKRERPAVPHAQRTASLGKTTLRRVFSHVARAMQERSRDTYRHVTSKAKRKRIAKAAAHARWDNQPWKKKSTAQKG